MNDSGRTFPPVEVGAETYVEDGMTLRDYFAGQALIGLTNKYDIWNEDAVATSAYVLADAMLKAREAAK